MTTPQTNAGSFLAQSRFGFGARLGEARLSGDPREALLAEIETPDGARIDDPALLSTARLLDEVFAYRKRRDRDRGMEILGKLSAVGVPEPNVAALLFPVSTGTGEPATANLAMTTQVTAPAVDLPPQQIAFRMEAKARISKASLAPIGFTERLVAFWSNHFCISAAKSDLARAAAGAFEREAIRPHVFGKFSDMLLAVEQHPVMLQFLDNQQSVGPNSLNGHAKHAGLNENLSREIFELHTMGVGSGYTQSDVTQLAYILTGWMFTGPEGKLGEPGTFVLNNNSHEPLAATMRGRLYLQDGALQGEAALTDLARENATALHIARKIARHFVADTPDADLVSLLAEVFRNSGGDLGALTKALATHPAAWSAPATKFRNPWEWVVASHRAFGNNPVDPGPSLNALNLLGMPLWQPDGPNGFPEEAAAWISPEGVKTRVELASQFARQIKEAPRPIALLDEILGPIASPATREAVARAETQEQAYALMILSPEFQRR